MNRETESRQVYASKLGRSFGEAAKRLYLVGIIIEDLLHA